MSTNYWGPVEFNEDCGYDWEKRGGTLVEHNTSSMVSWRVDGVERWCMTSDEWRALREAIRRLDRADGGGKP